MNKTIHEFLSGMMEFCPTSLKFHTINYFWQTLLTSSNFCMVVFEFFSSAYLLFLWQCNVLLTNLPWVVCVLKSERGGKILLKIQHLQLLVEGVEKWKNIW